MPWSLPLLKKSVEPSRSKKTSIKSHHIATFEESSNVDSAESAGRTSVIRACSTWARRTSAFRACCIRVRRTPVVRACYT